MKNISLKTLSVFLCVALALCAVLTPGYIALAASGGKLGDGIEWSFNGGRFSVTGKGAVPAGATKGAISSFADKITSVTVGSGVTALDEGAFESCVNLKTVDLPASLCSIPEICFMGCSALTEIVIPSGVQMIGKMAFQNCTSLKNVSFPSKLHSIDEGAFKNCTSLKSVSLPGRLCSIGSEAFMNTGLTSLTLPSSVRSVNPWAFAQCKDLKNVILSSGMEYLQQCTFQNNDLDSLVLPKSIRSADEGAFYYCTLKEISYEGTRKEFEAINISNDSLGSVPGTTPKLFETAKLNIGLIGDLGNVDGKDGITAADARSVLRAAVKLDVIKEATAAFYAADVDRDAIITASDARSVLRAAVNLEDLKDIRPYQPKVCSKSQLDALESFNGTINDLLQSYDADILYGSETSPGGSLAVFYGEKQTLVMMFYKDEPVYFKHRFTPVLPSSSLSAISNETTYSQLKALDPGLVDNIFGKIPGSGFAFFENIRMLCTTDGYAYMISISADRVSNITRL